jgi:hypothetical protein
MEKGKLVGLCRMHRAFFRQAREAEMAALEAVEAAAGPHSGQGSPGGGPKYLTSPVPETPARWRRPGTTPTTDSIATLAVGAGLGVIWWLSPEGAWWPYLVAPAAAFLVVVGALGLVFNRR